MVVFLINKTEYYTSFFKELTTEESLVTLTLVLERLYSEEGFTSDEFETQLELAKSDVLDSKDSNTDPIKEIKKGETPPAFMRG